MWQVHNEKWVSPYNGGAELAGCGGGEAAFAKKPAVELARVQVKACLTQALAQSILPFSCRTRSEAVHLEVGTHTDEQARCTGDGRHPFQGAVLHDDACIDAGSLQRREHRLRPIALEKGGWQRRPAACCSNSCWA